MIYTITLNPSIDYVAQVDDLTLGSVNRSHDEFKFPGGKGINVSRILKRLEIDSKLLGFVGGFTGKFIQDKLVAEGLNCDFVQITADSRINIKLRAAEETEINGAGPQISPTEISQLKEQLQQLTAADTVILSGSAPASLPAGFYQELIEIIAAQKAQFVIDTTGQALLDALKYQPLLIKPNRDELEDLYHVKFNSMAEIVAVGKKLLAAGAQNVLISMAGDGALLITNQGVYQTNVLVRPLKNSVGAGDSMIAGFIGALIRSNDATEAFKYGVACGSGTAFSDDLASREIIDELLDEVEITQISDAEE